MSPRLLGTLLVVLAALSFASLSVVSRSAAALGLGTLAFVWWRSSLAGAVVGGAVGLGLAGGRIRLAGGRPVSGSARLALLIATLAASVLNLAIFASFQRVTVAVALILFYTYPALVTIGAARLFHERLDRVRLAAMLVASAGLLLVVLGPVFQTGIVQLDALGMGLAFLAAVCQSIYVLIGARGYPTVPSLQASAAILVGSGVLYLVLLAIVGGAGELLLPFAEPRLWPWVLAASLTGAAIPTTALLAGIRLIGPSRASILMTLEPVAAVGVAALFLAESPVPLQLLGGAAVLVAGAALQLSPGGGPARSVPEGAPEPV